MENLNDMFDLNNLIGRLRRIENDPAAQFEDIEDAFNDSRAADCCANYNHACRDIGITRSSGKII